MVTGIHMTPIEKGRFLLEPDTALDPSDPDRLITEILGELQKKNTRVIFYDLSRTPVIDTIYYEWLCLLAKSCSAAAITMTVIRMPPTAACSLASHMKSSPPFACALDTQSPPLNV
ncbi:hypothetical protein LZ24_00133 [Desulfobotulus alkaliphilus]|uniref:STAS domain-containing protein n=1 Tax=Desulfobotulus alkaliphilus TaxID=622671 RepID=A0A562S7D1_9BACT|nr:hypothetical protein [Desulfobotulus alkaliphilus]TWI77329.1 hypothetical protein LZ24_00133 [Desulfobotulus alkaliphilus]